MDNFLRENIAICTTNTSTQKQYSEVYISNSITDKHLTGHQTYVFPLWFYETDKKHVIQQNLLYDRQTLSSKTSNIKQEFIKSLSSVYGQNISPEEIFYYIYAILYSNVYRKQYEESLKIGFPKIPFTKQYQLFKQVSDLGNQLTMLHILKSLLLNKATSRFKESNGEFVKKWHYDSQQKRIYINDKQYFTNVEQKVWEYFIGAYQVLDKWLKDRKNRSLSSEEIAHYIKIIEAIRQTLLIQKKIDSLYPEVEKKLVV